MAIKEPSAKPAHGAEADLPQLDVLTLIMRDHLLVEQLLNDYLRSQDQSEKQAVLDRLIRHLQQHEESEEKAFWPRVRETIPKGEALVSRRLAEEEQGKALIAKLQSVRPGDAEFETRMHALLKAVLEHATEEEKQIFPRVLESFRGAELLRMGKDFEQAKMAASATSR